MWSRARRAGALVAGAALGVGCTAIGGHHSRPAPTAGAQDRLVFSGDDAAAGHSRVASFDIRNIDAGPIVVSATSQARFRLACPATRTVRVKVGDGSNELTVRQVKGQVLLRTTVREGGHWYVLARNFGALVSRDQPERIRPSAYGCGR